MVHFTNCLAWKKSYALSMKIYKLTSSFPDSEKFNLTSQMQRASTSVLANIAEGWGRYHYKDKKRFFYLARGSIYELENFILIANGLGYINESFEELINEVTECGKLCNGLINSVGKTDKPAK